MKHDYAITFACYNALDFTKKCVDSLVKTGTPLERVAVIDNGSTDATRDYLNTLPLGGRIFNHGNLACGAAWNQGILHFQAEWTVIMNNDIVVPAGWIDALINTAIEKGLKVVSPAMIEGALDYDLDTFARESSQKMQNVVRRQTQHLVCLCVHRSVFQEIGFFRATPKLWLFSRKIREGKRMPFFRCSRKYVHRIPSDGLFGSSNHTRCIPYGGTRSDGTRRTRYYHRSTI
jgi:GT2 family glycosyltransferase